MEPRCHNHADRVATIACERCGSFVCNDCRSAQGLDRGPECERCWEAIRARNRPRARLSALVSIACSVVLSAYLAAIPALPSVRGQTVAITGAALGWGALVALALSFMFGRRGSFRYPLLAALVLPLPLVIAIAGAAFLGLEMPG